MAIMIFTHTMNNESETLVTSSDVDDVLSITYADSVTDDNMLPMVPDAHFGDSLRVVTINSCGSGEHFAKGEIVVDFAVDELLDVVFVTELKTTLARTKNMSIRRQGFYSWWGARDVRQSYSDGILVLVWDEWAKYVQ